MSEMCKWLHEQLDQLPLVRFPFDLSQLPNNGIYFLYEDGETWGNEANKLRIVRIGTHRKVGNFRNRIAEHYLFDEAKMDFDQNKPAPKDRSVFRKHMGRAILNKQGDDYLKFWEIDFTLRKNREKHMHERNISREKSLEHKITERIRTQFSFRFIIINDKVRRKEFEKTFIGTVAYCKICKPTENWLGNFSPNNKIRESGLWQIQHLKAKGLSEIDKCGVFEAINDTNIWILNNEEINRNKI